MSVGKEVLLLFFGDGEAEFFHGGKHVFPHGAPGVHGFVAQKVAGMVGDAYQDALTFQPASSQGADGAGGAQESFGCAASEADDAGGLYGSDFCQYQGETGGDFFFRGGAVGCSLGGSHGGAEFADVGDVYFLSAESHGCEDLIEFLSGSSYEGFPESLFVVSGGFAHQHEAGMRGACGKDHGFPEASQSEGRFPVLRSLAEVGEFLFDGVGNSGRNVAGNRGIGGGRGGGCGGGRCGGGRRGGRNGGCGGGRRGGRRVGGVCRCVCACCGFRIC